MPRAERRKREKGKLLIESEKKIPKLTKFFKTERTCSVSAEAEVTLALTLKKDDVFVNQDENSYRLKMRFPKRK